MDREIVCNILGLAAPDSILNGYAQCWVDLVQTTQPARQSQEAVTLINLLEKYSCTCAALQNFAEQRAYSLFFLVGAAAAPTLSPGILGMPSVARRVLITCNDFHDIECTLSLLTGMLDAAPGATMAVVSLKGPGCCGRRDSTAADGNDGLVCRRSRMTLEKRSG